MQVNGFRLYQHPLFRAQFDKLLNAAEKIQQQQPTNFKEHKTVKLLAKITKLITEEIPADPGHERWNQGATLGRDHKHWKRAKCGRFRLFFRYINTRQRKAIIYAWVNDENTQRKSGDKNDPYALFARCLERGNPPESIDGLLEASIDLEFWL